MAGGKGREVSQSGTCGAPMPSEVERALSSASKALFSSNITDQGLDQVQVQINPVLVHGVLRRIEATFQLVKG
jgi:hypothetical protein